jgi:hypothetical protein
LHLPFRFYRERQEKKERLARQLLRESTPPPPRDRELERRRIQAREEQKISSHRLRRYRDPIEKDPEIAKLVRAERAHQEVSGGRYEHLGTCHLIWRPTRNPQGRTRYRLVSPESHESAHYL